MIEFDRKVVSMFLLRLNILNERRSSAAGD